MKETPHLPRRRLAIVSSHPIQYYAPWFRHLASLPELEIRVFYLWDFGVEARFDPEFGHPVQWDIPLLEGYDFTFIPNRSAHPGTDRFRGLDNPGLVSALADWKPDAILLFGYAYLSLLRVILSRRLASIPLLLRGDSHDLARPRGWKPALKRWLRSRIFRRFSAFLAVGQANANYFRNCGVPESRIFHAPHCVDNRRFQEASALAEAEAATWKASLGLPADALVVLFAGKLEIQKRPMDLLEAFLEAHDALLVADSPAPVLLFVGSGAWEERLRARSGDRTGRTVFFAPFQNQSRMPCVYAAADVLVLPSESETWGLSVNEAMNMARPAIVSHAVGCGPDLIRQDQTGWIFTAGDVPGLASTLARALTPGREALRRAGKAGRTVVSGYSFEAAAAVLLAALSTLPSPDRSFEEQRHED